MKKLTMFLTLCLLAAWSWAAAPRTNPLVETDTDGIGKYRMYQVTSTSPGPTATPIVFPTALPTATPITFPTVAPTPAGGWATLNAQQTQIAIATVGASGSNQLTQVAIATVQATGANQQAVLTAVATMQQQINVQATAIATVAASIVQLNTPTHGWNPSASASTVAVVTSATALVINVSSTAGFNGPCEICFSNFGPAAALRYQWGTSATAPVNLTSPVSGPIGHYQGATTTPLCLGPLFPGWIGYFSGVAASSTMLYNVDKAQ